MRKEASEAIEVDVAQTLEAGASRSVRLDKEEPKEINGIGDEQWTGPVAIRFNISNVQRPLAAASKVAGQGNRIVMEGSGGYIESIGTPLSHDLTHTTTVFCVPGHGCHPSALPPIYSQNDLLSGNLDCAVNNATEQQPSFNQHHPDCPSRPVDDRHRPTSTDIHIDIAITTTTRTILSCR